MPGLRYVLLPGYANPILDFLAERLAPPAEPDPPEPPAATVTWRRSTHRFWSPRPLFPSKYDWREV